MNMYKQLIKVLAVLCALGPTGQVMAQPDPGNAPKAANPTNRNRAERNRAGVRGQAARVEREKERQARVQERRLQNVARLMTAYGFTDKKLHESLANFHNEVDTARLALTQAQLKLRLALRNQAMTEAQLGTLVNEYKVAQEDYQERRRQAETRLDQQVGYSKKPRLQAVLLISGVLAPVQAR